MPKPIVAVVRDEHGNTFLRMSGEVTVVWVHPDADDNDRVFEVTRREPMRKLQRYLGRLSTWGNDQDEIQKKAEAEVNAIIDRGFWREHMDKLFADPPGTRQHRRKHTAETRTRGKSGSRRASGLPI